MKLILVVITFSLVGQAISDLDISKSRDELLTLTEGLEFDVHRDVDSFNVEVKQIYLNQLVNGDVAKEANKRGINGFLSNSIGYLKSLQDVQHAQCFEGKFEKIGWIKNQAEEIFEDCFSNTITELEALREANYLHVTQILESTSKFEQITNKCLQLEGVEGLQCLFDGAEKIRKLAVNLKFEAKRLLVATSSAASDITGKLNACSGNAVKRVERDVLTLVEDVKLCMDHSTKP